MTKNKKIYIAGHRGLLGSAVVRELKSKGFDNLITATSDEVDLTNQEQTFSFLEDQKPDLIYLCAAKVGGIRANMLAPGEFLYRNLAIQNNVIEGARKIGVEKLLFVGSSCIYPKEAECPIKEESFMTGPFEPTNEGYALAKASGIRLCQFYRKQYGCNFITALPTNLFGINDQYDPEKSHLLPALIRKAHIAKINKQTEIEIWGSGKPKREFMLSDDCASALVHLMNNYSGEEPINVGTGEDLSVFELAELTCKVIGLEAKIKTDPTKPDGMMRKLLDVSKLKALGWTSKISLESGIEIAYNDFLTKNNGVNLA
ncbi:MAG: GDP-L-fucose synthase [Oligoflexia bacterium]|nr:GDP-L-fucose synthase [Oligoflexia bacterium]